MADHFFVTEDILDVQHYIHLVSEPAYGAVSSFLGTVRSPNLGQDVRYIDYEGYEAMLQTQMAVLAKELRETFDIGRLVLAHRLGRLVPGDASIAIVISSQHRNAALHACERGINRAKELLPVWKLEVNVDGSQWVEGSAVAGEQLG